MGRVGPATVALSTLLAAAACSPPPPSARERAEAQDAADEGAHDDRAPEHATEEVAKLPVAADNGFGTAVTWRSFDDGLREAKATGKPLMMVVHTSWCSRCKALKPSFSTPDVAKMAEQFVMVNVDQDEDERVMAYGPDGTYIPRVMFFDPSGKLDPEIANERSPKFKYFYTAPLDLLNSMHVAIQRHGKPT